MNVFSGKPYGSTPQVDPLGTTLAWFSGLYLKAWKNMYIRPHEKLKYYKYQNRSQHNMAGSLLHEP